MSIRQADFIASLVLAGFSLYLMAESAKLPIGYIAGEGIGGGAFPFWLSLGMLICCIWNTMNSLAKKSEISRSNSLYLHRQNFVKLVTNAGSLAIALATVPLIGMYGAVMLLLLFHLRFVGKLSWILTAILTLSAPIIMFFFFEATLNITLPKGQTEPLFYPLYDLFL